jgi:hypothetical protein
VLGERVAPLAVPVGTVCGISQPATHARLVLVGHRGSRPRKARARSTRPVGESSGASVPAVRRRSRQPSHSYPSRTRSSSVETRGPEGDYWGFQLSNALWNTLDFLRQPPDQPQPDAGTRRPGRAAEARAGTRGPGRSELAGHARPRAGSHPRPAQPGTARCVCPLTSSSSPTSGTNCRRPRRRSTRHRVPDPGGAAAPGRPDAAGLTARGQPTVGTRADSASRRASGIAVGLRDSRSTYTWTKWPVAAGWSEPAAWRTIS